MSNSLNTKQLNALIQVSKTVNAHLDLDAVLKSVMDVTTNVMRVEASSLVLIDEETGDLIFHITEGEKAKVIKQIRMKSGEGIVGWVVQSGKSTIVNDVTKDSRFYKSADKKSGFTTKSILCVPIATKDRLWGAIEVINKLDCHDFNEQDLVLCEAIAGQSAIAIENAVLHREIVRSERLAAIGQTIAGLAHCIKNVLNGIQAGSFIIDLGLRKNESSRVLKGWEIVKKNNAFMQGLVLDMLTYSKERKPEYESVDINEIIKAVCDLMGPKAKEKGIALCCTPNHSLGKVEIDPKGIQRCILNLISNAIDACENIKNAHVDVTTEVFNISSFKIKISDNGCGMPPDVKEKLFQAFFSTKGSNGTGLGLIVTNKIIKEHKGKIWVNSTLGRGTTFTIKLPKKRA